MSVLKIVVTVLKNIAILLMLALLAIAFGLVWDHLAWADCDPYCWSLFWLRYLCFFWFGRLIGADGEGAYDADMCEVMIHAFLFLLVIWILNKLFDRRMRRYR